jgi:hypothetical protein
LRDDAPALALRNGTAGHFVRAKALLQSATRAFGPKAVAPRRFSDIALDRRFIERLRSTIASAQEDPGAFAGKGLRDRAPDGALDAGRPGDLNLVLRSKQMLHI